MHCRDLKKETYRRERETDKHITYTYIHTQKREKESAKFLLWTEASFPRTKFKDRWGAPQPQPGKGRDNSALVPLDNTCGKRDESWLLLTRRIFLPTPTARGRLPGGRKKMMMACKSLPCPRSYSAHLRQGFER